MPATIAVAWGRPMTRRNAAGWLGVVKRRTILRRANSGQAVFHPDQGDGCYLNGFVE
jgi:hypothetical protein